MPGGQACLAKDFIDGMYTRGRFFFVELADLRARFVEERTHFVRKPNQFDFST
jgi:hypothetical protein